MDHTEKVVLQEGDLLFLCQNAYHEIFPAGTEDVAVNFIILPEFFQRPISMIERENVLRDFLLSTISGETGLSNYLHISAKGIIPVEDLMESMIWTILQRRSGTNTMIQTSMGLLFMNLSAFAENINRGTSGQDELVFHALQYIESHYIAGTLEELSAQLKLTTYQVSRLLKKHTGTSGQAETSAGGISALQYHAVSGICDDSHRLRQQQFLLPAIPGAVWLLAEGFPERYHSRE